MHIDDGNQLIAVPPAQRKPGNHVDPPARTDRAGDPSDGLLGELVRHRRLFPSPTLEAAEAQLTVAMRAWSAPRFNASRTT